MPLSSDQKALLITCLLLAAGVVLLAQQPFFWDTVVLSYRQADHALGLLNGDIHGWQRFFPPDDADPGHPALWGWYLGITWKIFGKSLLVSHLATLPWLWGIAAQVYFLVRRATREDGHVWKALLLLIALPPLCGHLALVTPDVMLLCLWLLSLRGILEERRGMALLALLLMGLVSLRALPLMGALGLFVLLRGSASLRKWLPVFLAGGSGILIWLSVHYLAKGWLLSHPASPWAEHRNMASLPGMVRNGAATGFWLLQYGAVFITLPALWLLVQERSKLRTSAWAQLWLLTGLSLAVFTVPFSNPINPRYLLPVLMAGTLWLVEASVRRGWKPWHYLALALPMLSGHLWLLPPPRANAWDCTLAHVPAAQARKDMQQYLDNQFASPSVIGTEFPLLAPPACTFLTGGPGFHAFDPETDSLLLYSNLSNGYPDSLFQALQTDWQPLHTVRNGPVTLHLLERTLPLRTSLP